MSSEHVQWSADDDCVFCQLVVEALAHYGLAVRDVEGVIWNP
jgi:hypothetical protein